MLILLLSKSLSQPLIWDFQESRGIVFLYKTEGTKNQFVSAHWAYDNQSANGFGSLDDIDDVSNKISIVLPTYALQAGQYTLISKERTETFFASPPTQVESYHLSSDTTGMIAFNDEQLAYAKQESQVVFLPKLREAQTIPFQGKESYQAQSSASKNLSIEKTIALRKKQHATNWITYLLLPISFLLMWGFFRASTSLSKRPWLPLLVGFVIIYHALPLAPNLLLVSEVGFDDPPTSASFLQAIASNPSSPISPSFSYPEGHNWLIMGPSWLAYLFCTPFVWIFDGVRAHNIGVALLCAALFWSITQYGKRLGLSKQAYVFAGLGGVLAPVFLNELDKLSLDRAFLFPLPLLLLFLQKRSQRFAIGAITSIGLLFYGQFYYGIFLGAALPFLLLHRLRLYHLKIAVAGFFVLLPGLLLLQQTTTGTPYDSNAFVFSDILSPVTADEIQQFVQKFDPRQGEGLGNRPMETSKDQLMTSIVNSVHPKDILFPSVYFCGQSLYWVWIVLALILVHRKKQVLRTSLDVLILSVFAMGPFIRASDQELITPLPFYLYQLGIPSFAQLKHPDRFAPMAAIIAAIPLAFLLDFFIKKLTSHRLRWGLMFLFLIVTLQVGIIKEDSQSAGDLPVQFGGETFRIGLKKLYIPQSSYIGSIIDFEFPEDSAVSIFPQTHPIQREQYIPFLTHHVYLQNPPPHGEFSQQQNRLWTEENRILNGLAYLSASNRTHTYFGLSVGKRDHQDLINNGLTHIAIHLPDLIDPIQRQLIADFLLPFAQKEYTNSNFDIYALDNK